MKQGSLHRGFTESISRRKIEVLESEGKRAWESVNLGLGLRDGNENSHLRTRHRVIGT